MKCYSHVNTVWSTFVTPKLKFYQHFLYKLDNHFAHTHALENVWRFPQNMLEASPISKYPFGFAWLVLVINPCVVKVSNSSLF